MNNLLFRLPRRSFLQAVRDGAEAARTSRAEDPWEATLRKLKERVAADGVERISTTDVFDTLEIPMRRRPTLTVRLSKLMGRLGWEQYSGAWTESWLIL